MADVREDGGPWLEAAFFVYPESGAVWRFKVECNGDIPGCMDISYQDYEKLEKASFNGQWVTKSELATIDVAQARLLQQALGRMIAFLEEVDGVQT